MQLWLTLVDIGPSAPIDLVVRAPEGSSVRELRPHLPGPLDAGGRCTDLYVGPVRLQDDDRLGSPPLVDGAVLHVGRPGSCEDATPAALLHLDVTGGPDAGLSHPLPPGRHVVGRSAEARVRVDDPRLSRAHVMVEVTDTATLVADLGTTNGSRLGQERLSGTPRTWPPGVPMRVGDTTLELRTAGSPSAATTFDGVGGISVNRRPRDLRPGEDVEITFPDRPQERPRGRLPLLAMVIPLLVAGPMAWLQHAPAYLLFGLMSPAMMAGSFLSERRGGRRIARREHAVWREQSAQAAAAVVRALAAETSVRRAAAPDPAELLRTAQQPLARLWERRPGDADFGCLRIGLGTVPARVRCLGDDPSAGPATVGDVPALVRLAELGVLGLAGPAEAVRGLARSLIAQVAGWHSPRDVRLTVVVAQPEAVASWAWAARLPHAREGAGDTCHAWFGGPNHLNHLNHLNLPTHANHADQLRQRVTELTALLDERAAARDHPGGAGQPGQRVLVILDGAGTLRQVPGLARVLDLGPGVGIFAICLDRDRSHLPVECTGVIEIPPPDEDAPVAASGLVEAATDIVLDRVSLGWAERLSRAMAPLRDGTPEATSAAPPDQARLVELLDVDPTNPVDLEIRWRTAPRSTNAVLGATADGTFSVDLRHDGPHILVGGTTGAGKSELLQTLIASLAVANAPDQLGFVLVDYKGGSAFDACADLPHTLGLVTDLDPQLTERALRSMGAELIRREEVLRSRGAKDLDEYHRLAGPGAPALPRLVLVIDEFRMLAEELPAFIDGMVRIAAVGRSLGVHLVLATQRPAGVVTADIAANVNLRIALRVRDQADSEDVIEAREAAAISTRTPGRAYARCGANPLVSFQTARVTGSAADQSRPFEVTRLSPGDIGEPPPTAPLSGDDAALSDLRAIVSAARAAADRLGLPANRSPWLPPLPDVVVLDDLARPLGWHAPYAVVDRPDRQSQETLAWDLADDGHLLVAGTGRSGRSTFLRTLAGSLATALPPESVHLHLIEGAAGTLQAISRLPHSGVVVSSDQTARGVQLLDRLAQEVVARQSALSAGGFGSLAEQHAGVDEGDRLPYLVLMLDGWESLTAAWERVHHGRPTESVQQLMRDGAAVGLRVVVTGDRSLLMSRLASLVRDRIVLRQADPADLVLCGIPVAAVPHHLPPGRGLRVADQAEVQVALLAPEPSSAIQTAALSRIAEQVRCSPWATRAQRPLRIEPLPARTGYAEVAARASERAEDWTLVGVGGDAADPVGLSGLEPIVVAGPPRSGRSTALATMARWLVDHGRAVVAVVAAPAPSPWCSLAAKDRVDLAHDPEQLRQLLDARPASCVIVDDVERIVDSETEDVVLQWLKSPAASTSALIVGGTTSDLMASFRGLAPLARRSGRGVLLNPTTYDGELLGVQIGTSDDSARIPGRGLLVQDGRAIPVQVAG